MDDFQAWLSRMKEQSGRDRGRDYFEPRLTPQNRQEDWLTQAERRVWRNARAGMYECSVTELRRRKILIAQATWQGIVVPSRMPEILR